jgi:hypothetical protein
VSADVRLWHIGVTGSGDPEAFSFHEFVFDSIN